MRFHIFTSLAVLICSVPCAVVAKDLVIPAATAPAVPETAPSAQAFAPGGWALEGEAFGDLNRDGRADLVLVIQGRDQKLVVANPDGLGARSLDTNPRYIVVAFAEAGGGFRRVLLNGTLITRWTDPVLEDAWRPESGLRAGNGAFRIRLHAFASAGSWSAGDAQFTFRWQNGRFEMIGYDSTTIHRATGEVDEVSINYSTGRVKLTRGAIEHDRETVRYQTLKDRRIRSIDEIGDGLEFDPGVEP